MTIESRHGATKLELDCLDATFLTQSFLDLHDGFNRKDFLRKEYALPESREMCDVICGSFGQPGMELYDVQIQPKRLDSDNKHVLLGFSAGLDSVFQAIDLKEHGYDVHLFFARNINTYENGQSWKHAVPIAKKLNLDLLSMNVKKSRNNDFRQAWPENPMKNQLIMAVMSDICIERGWKYISLGDDFDLDIIKAVPGVNTTDAKEVTTAFLKCVKHYVQGIEFLKIRGGNDKAKRLRKLLSYNLQDDYYSCVQAGRFNQSFRKKMQSKYGVSLFGNNCGCCRKCCMHNLLMHYSNMRRFPDAFIQHCWDKMYSTGCGADYEFFRPDLPLELRIKNLFSY